jgi:PAS domain S-box-containing protein
MSSVTAYVLAIVAVVTAVLLRWLLDPLMGDAFPLVTLFGAVAAAVWVGGYRPAIVSAILGYTACAYLFISPRGQLWVWDGANATGLAAYLFTCVLIIGFGQAMRVSQIRASERQELLRVTLSSIGDAVITTDVDSHVTYMNAVAESLTGWKGQEALGQPLASIFRIVNEVTRQPAESPATRALREGTVVGLANHTLLLRKDDVECPIDDSAAPIRDERGRVSGCVLIFRDVTAQRQSERDRAAQLLTARLLASIVESSDDAIVSKSLDGVIKSWNAAAERLFGYSSEEAVGRHISLVIPPERIAEEDHIIASLKAGQRIDHFETERQRRDGQRISVSLTVSPIKDDAGNVIGASKIVRDVTERKRVEADLRRLAAHLSEADKRKDEFLATLAHELRNPLAPLCNMLEVLKRSQGDSETLERARNTMDRQLAQLVRLVDDLLDLNRITHNRLELRQSQVELSSVIEQAVEASRPLADSAGHELRVSLPDEQLYTYADPARLVQVFDNLLNNSCKYTNPGGEIWVTAERQGAEVVVTVKDTGSGIPPDKLDSIFDMFMQVDRSAARSQGGLGIGLTLVKRLVEMHGGSIEARSAGEGRGSEFAVRLPILAGSVKPSRPVPRSAAQLPENRRILIVDDNSDAAVSLAMLLQIAGNHTYTAHDGFEALEAVERYRPDVMLLDIGLPKLSGHEVCRRVRQRPDGSAIVIIALTGWGQESDRRKSQDAGFDGHLVKPVDYGALVDLLNSVGSTAGRVTNAE